MSAADLPTILKQAERLHMAGRHRQAAVVYRRALDLDPANAHILHALGLLAQEVGRHDAALPLLRRAAAGEPGNADYQHALADLYFGRGQFDHAARHFQEAARLDPRRAAAYARLGQALAQLGQWEEAARALGRAVVVGGLAPESPPAEALAAGEEVPVSAGVPLEAAASAAASDDLGPPPLVAFDGAASGAAPAAVGPDAYGLESALTPAGRSVRLSRLGHTLWEDDAGGRGGAAVLELAPPPEFFGATPGPRGLDDVHADPPFGTDVPPLAGWPVLAEAAAAPDSDGASHITITVTQPVPAAAINTDPNGVEPDGAEFMGGEIAPPGVAVPGSESPGGEPAFAAPAVEFSIVQVVSPPVGVETAGIGGAIFPGDAPPVAAEPALPGPFADDADAPLVVMAAVVDAPPPAAAAEDAATAAVPAPPAADDREAARHLEQRPSAPAEAENLWPEEAVEDDWLSAAAATTAAGPESGSAAEPETTAEEADTDDDLPEGGEGDDAPEPAGLPAADDEAYNPRLLRKRRRKQVSSEARDLRARGGQFLRQRKPDEAVASFSRLVELHPGSAKAYRDLGAALLRSERLEEAVEKFQKALELRPRFADAYASLGDAYHLLGKIDQAITCYRAVLRLKPTAAKTHSNLLLTLNYHHKFLPEMVCEEHLLWAQRHAEPLTAAARPHSNDRVTKRRLRVGYISPDFRRHSVNYFVEPVLTSHDRTRFHVTCYSDAIRPDDVTDRIAGLCDNWRDVRGMTDEDVARLVRDDKIDLLVDLSGHTGGNRLLVFARKPAPVQVTYLGYPNTTGMQAMDWRLTDRVADPPGLTERFHTERFARLPASFLCYAPPPEAPPPGEPPVRKNGHVTFGCFNILTKVTPEVMGLWAKVLTAVPGSRLLMKDRTGTLAYPGRRRYVLDVFRYHGIDADRLDLRGKDPDHADHLAAYGQVDVILDPFPYQGTTTTCEALWMGVPVVTMSGKTHVSRVGASLLTTLKLPEMIATLPEEYVAKAAALARDPDNLLFLRETLRDRMARSPLTDAKAFTREVEKLYRQMWARWCAKVKAATAGARDAGSVVTLSDG